MGKDTLARHLAESADAHWVHVKISRALKDSAMTLFGLSESEVEGDEKDLKLSRAPFAASGVTPRRILQWLGTDVMQHALGRDLLPDVGRHFWIGRTVEEIRGHLDGMVPRDEGGLGVRSERNVVISDVRFSHELDVLEREFGDALLKMYVSRPLWGKRSGEDAHESEAGVTLLRDRADVTITNRESDIPAFLESCLEAIQAKHERVLHTRSL